MGGRYLITGVQLGLLQGLVKIEDFIGFKKLLDDIQENQFVGNSDNAILSDIKNLMADYERK